MCKLVKERGIFQMVKIMTDYELVLCITSNDNCTLLHSENVYALMYSAELILHGLALDLVRH